MTEASAQIEYGSNPQAGRYVESLGTKIYYEIYGDGPPLVMLHGALYGYIDEYSKHIPVLAKHFKVIAIATRGHGRSALGMKPLSYALLAEDIKMVLDNEKITAASFFGFSTGANVARYFNVHYRNYVTKLVSIAGGVESKPQDIERIKNMTFASFEENNKKFVNYRKSQMPEPARFPEVIENLKLLWLDREFLKKDAFASVRNPVLIIVGDRDDYYDIEQTVEVYRNTPTGRLCVVPDRNHVGLLFDESVLINTVIPFLLEK
jgi:pimeloyl-ACP methyl ester carboxylesterase